MWGIVAGQFAFLSDCLLEESMVPMLALNDKVGQIKTWTLICVSVCALALLFAVYVLMNVVPDILPLGKEEQTQRLLNEIVEISASYNRVVSNEETRVEIESLLLTSPREALGRYIAEWVSGGWDVYGQLSSCIVERGSNEWVVVDAWGRPIEVETLHGTKGIDASVPYFRMARQWVRIWSRGPDGENAGGFEDDIRIRRTLPPYVMRGFLLYDYDSMTMKCLDMYSI